jgi:adenylosuccinate lyase
MKGLVDSLVVFPERMQANLDSTRGLAFSGTLLLALAEKGLTREESYALVQGHAMETWDHGGALRDRIVADEKVTAHLSAQAIEKAFSLDEALRHVDAIFERTLANNAESTS